MYFGNVTTLFFQAVCRFWLDQVTNSLEYSQDVLRRRVSKDMIFNKKLRLNVKDVFIVFMRFV